MTQKQELRGGGGLFKGPEKHDILTIFKFPYFQDHESTDGIDGTLTPKSGRHIGIHKENFYTWCFNQA